MASGLPSWRRNNTTSVFVGWLLVTVSVEEGRGYTEGLQHSKERWSSEKRAARPQQSPLCHHSGLRTPIFPSQSERKNTDADGIHANVQAYGHC